MSVTFFICSQFKNPVYGAMSTSTHNKTSRRFFWIFTRERHLQGRERERKNKLVQKSTFLSLSLPLSVSLSWLSFPSPSLFPSLCRFLTVLRRTCGRLAGEIRNCGVRFCERESLHQHFLPYYKIKIKTKIYIFTIDIPENMFYNIFTRNRTLVRYAAATTIFLPKQRRS